MQMGVCLCELNFFFGYAIWLTPPLTLSTATAVAAERVAVMVMEVVVGVAGRTLAGFVAQSV